MKVWLVALVALVSVAGCSKQHPPTRLQGPAILAHIPADTPYVMVSLEPMPRDYLEYYLRSNRPKLARALETLRALDAERMKVMVALLEEFEAHFTVEGFAELGLPTNGRMAIYGLGLLPVARVELADAARFSAFLERVLARAGASVVRGEMKGRKTWSYAFESQGSPTVVLALDGKDLVFVVAPASGIERQLARALGDEKVGPTMLETGRLQALATAHGFKAWFLGYADVALGLQALESDRDVLVSFGAELPAFPPPCREELGALAATAPRLIFGVDELSAGRARATVEIELRPELARDLLAARVSVPGMGQPLGDNVISMGAAVDLSAGARALWAEAQRVAETPRQCGALAPVTEGARDLVRVLAGPIPAPWSSVRGFAVTVADASSTLGIPNVKAFGVLAATDVIHLIDLARQSFPSLSGVRIPEDGTPVALPAGLIPFMPEAHVAMRGGLLGLSLGAGMRTELARLMSAPAHPDRAMFTFAYDEKKLYEIVKSFGGEAAAAELAGDSKGWGTIEVTERGLVLRGEQTWPTAAPAPAP